MTILSEDDKQTVKRTVPKANNKIHAVAVAKLYICLPSSKRWAYTGLQGAAVLAEDKVGNTFWLKMVDVSPANRGVIWDQEIYDSWSYNQDRIFFHTFELEDCMAALSFSDDKEAKQFKKKMDEREKNAHKSTRAKAFASGAAPGRGGGVGAVGGGGPQKHHSRFGISNLLPGHRNSSAAQQQPPPQSIIPPRDVTIGRSSPAPARSQASSEIDLSDPAVQGVLDELLQMGITEDQLHEHAGFIKTYLEQNKATAAAEEQRRARAPPPPPPPGAMPSRDSVANLSPQNTGSSSGTSKRGPPPAPPAPRRGAAPQRPPSPSPSPPRAPSPPQPRFRAPPPLADAGKYANVPPAAPARARATSQSTPGPPPPPRPPKTPLEEEAPSGHKFGVPPPFAGDRAVPPPPPARGAVPPPPPARDSTYQATSAANVPMPPPLPPSANRAVPPPPSSSGPPPPPPLPPSSARPVPPAPSSGGPPPPPPMPPSSSSGPPPPPMPPRAPAAPHTDDVPALPTAPVPGRGGLLADIQKGARLKRVSSQEKRDRSQAMVPGSEPAAPPPPSGGASGGAGGGDAGGGLADSLAKALAARKSKVSHSDDEDDKDDWE